MRTLSVLVLFAVAPIVIADDKDKKKELTGSYTRKADQMELKMEFKKDKVLAVHGTVGDAGFVMTSKYTRDADGIYHCEVTNFEKKGDFPVTKDKGYKFTFKLEVKEKSIVMSDLTGDDIQDEQKKAVEGEYEKAAGD